MLITLKTLQQQSFKIDIDEEETVRVKTTQWGFVEEGGLGTEYRLTNYKRVVKVGRVTKCTPLQCIWCEMYVLLQRYYVESLVNRAEWVVGSSI